MILSPRQLLNNFCMGIMFLLTLLLCSNALSALTVIFLGVQVIPNMNNPLLLSSGVSNFWQRWNIMVHTTLKNAIYKPVWLRLGFSKSTAGLAAFFMSGLFHEWMLFAVG